MGKRSREKKEKRLNNDNASYGQILGKRTSLERVLLLIIKIGTYLALFTPLIINRSFFFPFVSPKTIFFRIITDIIFIAYILLVIFNRRYLPRINILTIAIAIFIGIAILASFLGVDWQRSFWSTFERMTGILTLLHLFVFFIILTSVFRTRSDWEKILTVSILVGVILTLNVFLSTDKTFGRGGGTIGNSSFMASYLLFNIFFAIILFFTKSGFWKIFYGVALLLMICLIYFNPVEPTQGAMGAFILGIFLMGLGYMIFAKNKLLMKLMPVALVLTVIFGFFITKTNFFNEKFIDLRDGFPDWARKIVWSMGFDSFKEKPLLGWGLENFNIPFAKYFSPELPLTADIWYDRVHNIVLDMLVEIGAIGFLAYLAIFAVAVVCLLKLCPKVNEKKNLLFPLGMITLLAVYFAQNLFVFDMVSTYMMFFLSLGFIFFLISKKETEVLDEVRQERTPLRTSFGVLLIIIALSALYFGNIQPARASLAIVQGIAAPLSETVPAFKKALKLSPISESETPEQAIKKMSDMSFDSSLDKKVLTEGFEWATQVGEKSLEENPQDFRLYLLLGRSYNDFYNLTQDPAKLSLAEEKLKKAEELSSDNQQVYWALAQTRLFQGKGEEAIELLQKAVDLEPRYGIAHWYQALAYKIIGENALALEKLKDAEKAGYDWRNNVGDAQRALSIYQGNQDYQGLLDLYTQLLEKYPTNHEFWVGLAVAQANLGQFSEARKSAEKAIEINPELASQLEEFLKNLPQ